MVMTFEQIITTYYSKEFSQGLFGLAMDADQVVISFWNVPNVTQPTHDEVMALGTPQLEFQYNLQNFFLQFSPFIENFIDSIAIARGYGNSLYCLSYINSSNTQWKADAITFNTWRDSLWVYIEQQKTLIQNGTRPIPASLSQLTSEFPAIVWS